MLSGKASPFRRQYVQPNSPLNCFIDCNTGLASESTVHRIKCVLMCISWPSILTMKPVALNETYSCMMDSKYTSIIEGSPLPSYNPQRIIWSLRFCNDSSFNMIWMGHNDRLVYLSRQTPSNFICSVTSFGPCTTTSSW